MNAERWQKIDEAFHQVLACAEDERAACLATICDGDPLLMDEVRSLISTYDADDEFLREPELTAGLEILAALDTASLEGETIGHYVLQELIGIGGMGQVYRGWDTKLERNVAVKILPPSFSQHSDWVSRFQQEARAASRIGHPHIAHVYEVGESHGRHYIAMEFVHGITLRELILRGPLDARDAVELVIQAAQALEAAHETNVLHRDIKPENIMVRRDGFVKVVDFGLARTSNAPVPSGPASANSTDQTKTAAGVIMGSPAYMAPEQVRGERLDHRCDLWGLGVVLFELLTGISPFLQETPDQTLKAIASDQTKLLDRIRDILPSKLRSVVKRSLEKDIFDRYQTAQAFIDDLTSIYGESRATGTKALIATVAAGQGDTVGVTASASLRQRIATIATRSWKAAGRSKKHLILIGAFTVALVATIVTVKYAHFTKPRPSPIRSLAVLRLVNLSGNTEAEYLSEGLSENLINRLSRLEQLKVIDSESSFKFKTGSVDPDAVVRELEVTGIVSGTIKRDGEDLIVNLILLDAGKTEPRWSASFKYRAADVPQTLDELSAQIAGELGLDLTGADIGRLGSTQKSDGKAYDLYMQGRSSWNELTEPSLNKSIELFDQAIAVDPKFALAYAGLADSRITLGANFGTAEQDYPQALRAAEQALKLDDKLPEAHYAMAVTKYVYRWDLTGAEGELKTCLLLRPNFAKASSLQSSIDISRGDLPAANRHLDRALELDRTSLLYNTRRYFLLSCQHKNDEAIKVVMDLIKQNDKIPFLYSDLAVLYARKGNKEDALSASQTATIMAENDPTTIASSGEVRAMIGKSDDVKWFLQQLQNREGKRDVQAYLIALIYSEQGDRDQTFKWLEKARLQRAAHLLLLRVDPGFDKVRSDPRFDAFITSLNVT
jgi:serine/threonine protein kinase/TolB-like protein